MRLPHRCAWYDCSLDSESDPYEDPLSSYHALVALDVSPFLFDDHAESEPFEDPSEGDAPDPAPLQIVPTPPGFSHLLAVLVLPGQEIPFGRPYRTHPNGVRRMLTVRKRVRPPPSLLSDSFLEYSSRHSSSGYLSDRSSSEYSSDHSKSRLSLSSPPSRKRLRVFMPSSSSFDGPSRKRGRSPTTSLTATDHSPEALSRARADLFLMWGRR
ncbi:hypothetical protein Tco_1518713 [Tanacetum coccineum]